MVSSSNCPHPHQTFSSFVLPVHSPRPIRQISESEGKVLQSRECVRVIRLVLRLREGILWLAIPTVSASKEGGYIEDRHLNVHENDVDLFFWRILRC